MTRATNPKRLGEPVCAWASHTRHDGADQLLSTHCYPESDIDYALEQLPGARHLLLVAIVPLAKMSRREAQQYIRRKYGNLK